jgi:hypothetical protein
MGSLQICAGETVTESELFSSLGGSPDMGGSWSPTLAGADTYTYTVSGAPDCPDATAQVTVTEQTAPNAGTNGTLQICAGETVTESELFSSLGGSPGYGRQLESDTCWCRHLHLHGKRPPRRIVPMQPHK